MLTIFGPVYGDVDQRLINAIQYGINTIDTHKCRGDGRFKLRPATPCACPNQIYGRPRDDRTEDPRPR